jgi:hypothetical protein
MRCDGRGEGTHQSVVAASHARDAKRIRIIDASGQELLADDVGIRRLVSLDKPQRELAIPATDLPHPPQRLDERSIRFPVIIECPQHTLKSLGEVAHGVEPPTLCTPPLAAHVHDAQVRLTRNRPRFLGVGMDELGAEFDGDREPRIVVRPDPTTDPITRLEYHNIEPMRDQSSRDGETRHAGTDDDDVDVFQSLPRVTQWFY